MLAARTAWRARSVASTRLKLPTASRRANSVDTLSPDSRFVQAINTLPLTPGVPCDIIIGDCGRGDSLNSSDGIIPNWSSHIDGVKIDHTVPSDHTAHQDSQIIATVLTILKSHAR